MGSSQSAHQEKKEKVEKLFRQNNRSNRSRSLDTRATEKVVRPVGASHSAKFPKHKSLVIRPVEEGVGGHISGLSLEQKRMIEVCWFKCSQKQIKKTAEEIFWGILQMDEDLLKLFKMDNVPRNKIKDNEYFKSHAANFAIVLNLVVTNMQENFSQACDALRTLGGSHVNLKSRGFQSMYWDIFTDCFEKSCPPTFKSKDERDAWSQMILFILAQMKIGYTNSDRQQDNRFLIPPQHL